MSRIRFSYREYSSANPLKLDGKYIGNPCDLGVEARYILEANNLKAHDGRPYLWDWNKPRMTAKHAPAPSKNMTKIFSILCDISPDTVTCDYTQAGGLKIAYKTRTGRYKTVTVPIDKIPVKDKKSLIRGLKSLGWENNND